MLCAFKCCCCCFLVVLFVLPQLTHCLRNVTVQVQPRIVRRGDNVTLICTYDLQNDNLYSLRWYKGTHEFFRYTPGDDPKFKLFSLVNIDVDLNKSDEHRVFIKNADFNLSALFLCELTTEAPNFTTITAQQKILVVELPEDAPKITTEKNTYTIGDTLKANCTSGPSKPGTELTFSINNMVVCKQCETERYPSGDLFVSKASLEMPLLQQHFSDGQLKLRCSAQIVGVYQRDTDLVFANAVAENIYEKATSRAQILQQWHIKIIYAAFFSFKHLF